MVGPERIAEIVARLREDGAVAVADHLASAQEGVFSGTELAMKWRFGLANALKVTRLSPSTRHEVEQVWGELQAELSR